MAKIVIVEDDDLIIDVVSTTLESNGHVVVPVRDGDEAVEAIFDNEAELVILDQMLPGTSGMHILAELRKRPEAIDLPIMMLTSRNTKLHMELADQGGADDYVTKPFNPDELPGRVKALLIGAGISRTARTHSEASVPEATNETGIEQDD